MPHDVRALCYGFFRKVQVLRACLFSVLRRQSLCHRHAKAGELRVLQNSAAEEELSV